MKRKTLQKILVYILLFLGILTILMPLYITVVTAFKSASESTVNYFALPSSLYLRNFQYIISKPAYWEAFRNTTLVTIIVCLGDVLIMPMLGYSVSRRMYNSKGWNRLYCYLLLGIFIPFQVKMIPIVQMMSALKMLNPLGLAILCIGSTTCEATFLYTGYLKGIPRELEEAAYIDGASTAKVFHSIVFPLMKPIIATAVIKDGLWAWNDFTLPLITLNRSPHYWTLVLYQYNFQTEAGVDYGLIFACLCLSIIPILIFYLFLQKQIVSGLTGGAVKG
jgi:raffinose/stachyose/melibiose transport system permease protein